jgi:hypothetical protein
VRFAEITRLGSFIVLALFMALLVYSNDGTAYAQHTITITINNNCSESIWVGANPQIQSGTINGQNISTLSGWELSSGQTAIVQVPLSWNSGRFWARTGCNFSNGVCPAPGVGNNPPPDCCDTGGCVNRSGQFALDCAKTGQPTATLAEITFVAADRRATTLAWSTAGTSL